jgi:hypothetical protein
MINKYLRILSSTFLVTILLAVISHAQVTTGSFLGFVTDPGGAAIPGAKVTAENEATGFKRTAVTNGSGEYVLGLLPVGRYTLTFEAPNFRRRAVKEVVLELDQKAKIDARLEIGQITEVVTSDERGSAPLARTETAESGEVIENKRIVDLPLNGRLFLQLAQLTPGVTTNPRGGFGEQLAGIFGPRITVMGARESDNYFTLDGVGITDRFYGTLSAPLSVDAVQEFKVQSNLYSAESGTFGGAQINIAVKSGTNDLHGSVYEFIRNDPFANNVIPDDRISPVARGLLQFVPQANLPGANNNLVGSPQEINDGDQFTIRTDYRRGDNDTLFARYTFFNVSAYQPYGFVQFATSPISLPGFGNFLKQRTHNVAITESHIFSPTLIGEFKAGFNRTAGGQFQQNSNVDFANQFNIAGISRDPFDRGIPRIIVAPFNSFGDVTTPLSRRDNDFQFNYNVSWFLGKHTLNFGAMYKRIQFNPVVPSSKRGQFTFTGNYTGNAFADFLLGLPLNARGGSGSSQVYLRGNEYQGFVQDDWKVSQRLTVNLGVRYEYSSPFSEKFNRWSTLDIQNRQVIVASEDGQFPRELFIPGIEQQLAPLPIVTSEAAGLDRSLVNKDLNNVAPRVGFAFDVFGNQKTVIRAGYGIFYSSAPYNSFTLQSLAAPFFKGVNANNSLTNPAPITTILSNPLLGTPGWASYDINFVTPYYQQYNFGIQQLITRDLLVEAQYLGSMGTNLHTNIFYNVPNPSPTTTPSVAARSPFPNLGNNSLQASAGKSNYHAGVLRAEKRLSFGLAVNGSYTFSKSIDTDSLANQGVSTNLDQSNIKNLERALSTFDIRHRLTVSFTYDLPFKFGNKYLNATLSGWQAGGIITEQSGQPFTVNITGDRANNGLLNQRPNLVGDPNLPSDQRTVERWFNTAAFVVQPVGTLGTAGRDILEGPGTNIVDFSLLKNIPFSERYRLQFRTEFFNLFNHANFDFPERFCGGAVAGGACTAPQFGRIGAARDPRILQFGLKFLY